MLALAFAAGPLLGVPLQGDPARLLPTDTPTAPSFATDGPIEGIESADGTAYVYGSFDQVGSSEVGLAVRTASGDPVATQPISGAVEAIVSDGAGGWFVGGTITHAGDETRGNLVHVLSDGSLGGISPDVRGTVEALLLFGSTLYLAGKFDQVDGVTRHGLAALDAVTGSLLAWDPAAASPFGGTERVEALATDGDCLFVGGFFTQTFPGGTRSHFGAFDLATATLDPLDLSADSTVTDLVVDDGSLFLVGNFGSILGSARSRFAELDLPTGVLLSTSFLFDSDVQALVLVADRFVFTGGFSSIDGLPRQGLAAVDRATLTVTPWSPAVGGSDGSTTTVLALVGLDRTLYFGGHFTDVDGVERLHTAAWDFDLGGLSTWDPRPSGPLSPTVTTLGADDTSIALGGSFELTDALDRPGVFALDTVTSEISGWSPPLDGTVASVVLEDSSLIVGGSFDTTDGSGRSDLVRVDAVTGAIDLGFDPMLSSGGFVGHAVLAGDALVVAGSLNPSIQSFITSGVFDPTTGAYRAGSAFFSNRVNGLASEGNRVFVAGSFTSVDTPTQGTLTRGGGYAFDAATWIVDAWDPGADDDVEDLFLAEDRLHLVGSFNVLGPDVRRGYGQVDLTTGAATSVVADFDGPGTSPPSGVLVHEDVAYVTGSFDTVDGIFNERAAAIDAADGRLLAWYPLPDRDGSDVFVIGESLLLTGEFDVIGSRVSPGMAVFPFESFRTDDAPLSVSAGGTQALTLAAGPRLAGSAYWTFGSISGDAPGFTIRGLTIPLNYDDYFFTTLVAPGATPLVNGIGVLDALGEASASIVLPPGGDPGLIGIDVHHAYVCYTLAPITLPFASNSIVVTLDP